MLYELKIIRQSLAKPQKIWIKENETKLIYLISPLVIYKI